MIKNKKFKGVFVPMITIFKDNEEVDYDKIRNHVEYLINSGVHGFIPNAATSEFFSLSIEERKKITEIVIKQVNGRIPVLVGTAACATKDVIELSKHAENIGADGVMIVPHYYVPLSRAETCLHYEMIDKEIEIPIIIYNSPVVSYINIDPELLSKIINVTNNVMYLKDSSGSLNNIQDVLIRTNFDIGVFIGEEPIYLEAMYAGCVGMIPMTANALPEVFVEMFNLFADEKFIEARNLHYKFLSLLNYICLNSDNYCGISIVKSILKIRGRDVGITRMPIIPLPPQEEKKLKILLKEVDVI